MQSASLENNWEHKRQELESRWGVQTWRRFPLELKTREPIKTPERDPRAPAWWHGDEEASQSFFTGMRTGVQPPPRGGRR